MLALVLTAGSKYFWLWVSMALTGLNSYGSKQLWFKMVMALTCLPHGDRQKEVASVVLSPYHRIGPTYTALRTVRPIHAALRTVGPNKRAIAM